MEEKSFSLLGNFCIPNNSKEDLIKLHNESCMKSLQKPEIIYSETKVSSQNSVTYPPNKDPIWTKHLHLHCVIYKCVERPLEKDEKIFLIFLFQPSKEATHNLYFFANHFVITLVSQKICIFKIFIDPVKNNKHQSARNYPQVFDPLAHPIFNL